MSYLGESGDVQTDAHKHAHTHTHTHTHTNTHKHTYTYTYTYIHIHTHTHTHTRTHVRTYARLPVANHCGVLKRGNEGGACGHQLADGGGGQVNGRGNKVWTPERLQGIQ